MIIRASGLYSSVIHRFIVLNPSSVESNSVLFELYLFPTRFSILQTENLCLFSLENLLSSDTGKYENL